MSSDEVTIEYPEALYTLFNTSRAELPAIVVVNAALRDFPHHEVFPWHLSVLIDPIDFADQGMPTRNECQVLDAVGDLIEDAVLATRNAIFLARETWNGRRQLLYRVNDPEVAAGALRSLIDRGGQQREWEFRMEEDFEWAHAAPYLSLFDSAAASGF
jgi:hypothetical protein